MDERQSQALFDRARRVMPGGVNSPVRACAAVGRIPRFIARAFGDRIVDVDGKEYIDYICSWGPGILGHAHPKVVEAVRSACAEGLTYGAPTAREVELAELIRELVPSMEVSRMVSSGTEAVMSAVRVARGFTGRDDILKFDGCYHGHSDGLLVKAGSGLLTQRIGDETRIRGIEEAITTGTKHQAPGTRHQAPTSAGVPEDYIKHTFVVPYNDCEGVMRVFAERGQALAAVVVEPVAANNGVILPKPGFLQLLRELCTRHGALLIFDEVITGFRLGLAGAQTPGALPQPLAPSTKHQAHIPQHQALSTKHQAPIIPDLTTLGKIVGGGMSAAVYGGREEIMRRVAPDGDVYQAGTLSGNPIATAAGLVTLKLLRADPGIYKRLEAKTRRLAACAREVFAGFGEVAQIASLMSIHLDEAACAVRGREPNAFFAAWYSHLLENGIYVAPSRFEAMFVSDAHTDADIARTCEVMTTFRV